MDELSDDQVMRPASAQRELSDADVTKPAAPQVAPPLSTPVGDIPWQQQNLTPAPDPGIWERVQNIGRAFYHASNEGAGTEPLGFKDKDMKFLREWGVFTNERSADNPLSVVQHFNESIFYPAAAMLDAAIRAPMAVYHGVQGAGIEAGVPADIMTMPDAFMGMPHPTGVPKAFNADVMAKAKQLDVIGPPKPEPTFAETPFEQADRAVPGPSSLSAAATTGEEGGIRGHGPGEYNERGKAWIDKIDEPQDVRDAVEKIASENDYFPVARGGEASPAAVEAVAEAAGIHPSEIDAGQFSTHFDTDGKVRAVIQALRQTAKDYAEAAKIAAENPTPENLAAAAEAEMRHTHVVEYTMGLRAESGRSLAAWKDLLRQTEETRAKVEVGKQEVTGEAPKGTTDIIDAVGEVQQDLKEPGKKPGLQKLVDAAQALVDNANKPPAEKKPGASMSPEVQSLVDEAKNVLDRLGARKDAELDAFRDALQRLSDGEGKLSDTVDAARALVEKAEKEKAERAAKRTPKPGAEEASKAAAAKSKLMDAAKRLLDAAEGKAKEAAKRVESELAPLMETARQAVGVLRKMNLSKEIAAFRDAVNGKDPVAAKEAAQRLVEAEGKEASPLKEKAPVEYAQVMAAARRVAKAGEATVKAEKPEMMPDVKELIDNAKKAASELQGERKSEMERLIAAAEKQAAEMTKVNPPKNLAEALPPELQALVDKTKRVVDRFGGIARGERAALLLARTGRTFAEQEQLARSVAGLTPNQVAKVLNKLRTSAEAGKPGWFYWLWQQGLISGLITHSKYFGVNTITIFMERVITPFLGALLDRARGQNTSIVGPLYANIAMVHALPDALAAAAQAFKTGIRIPLESELRLFRRGEESPQTKGAASAFNQVTAPDWGIWERVFNETQLDAAAKVLGIPGKSANMIHTFYKVLSERASQSTRAFQAAHEEGVTGDKFWERYRHHLDNPTDEALRGAVNDAYTGAFMGHLGPELTKFSQALSKNPVSKWLFPFQHIPWNIERMTVEYSPFAVLGPEMRAALKGDKGVPAQSLAMAKMVVGSSVLGYFMHKTLSGQGTGEYPHDPQERRRWEMLGIRPNSIQIGGQWVSHERLGPIGNVAHMGAAIGSIIHHYDGQDDNALTSAIWAASVAAANQVGNEVGFQSLKNIIESLESEKRADRFAAWQVGSFMPFSSFISQNASIVDPYQRKAQSIVDGLKYRVPLLRETLLPKRDPIYGTPLPNPSYHTVTPTGPINTDPVKAELDRANVFPAAPEDRINGVKLTPKLYDEYQVLAGGLTKFMLESAINQPGWSDNPIYARKKSAEIMIETARKSAQAAMQARHPELILLGVRQRLEYIEGLSKTPRPKTSPKELAEP